MISNSASCSLFWSSLRLSNTPLPITTGSLHQSDGPNVVEDDAEADIEAKEDRTEGGSPGIR